MIRFVTAMILMLCVQSVGLAQTVIHPRKEKIPVSLDPRFELSHEVEGVGSWGWNSREVASFGVDEGDQSQMIGTVWAMDVDYSGTLYYIDLFYSEVRAYDYEGNWISNVGTPGIGPGELNSPLGLMLTSGGEVVIADRMANHVFERQENEFKFVSTQRLARPSINGQMCAMNEYYYVINHEFEDGSVQNGLIHKYTVDGEWIGSFGDPYDYDNVFISSMFALETFIACNSEHQTIAMVTNHIPAMTGYSDQGKKIWQVTFPDYRPDKIKEGQDKVGEFHQVMRENNTSTFKSLFSDGGYFYVTYSFLSKFMGFLPPIEFSEGHAFEVDAQTGLGVYLGAAGPEPGEHLMVMDGDYRFTVTENDGFPQVRIYKSR